MRCTAAAVVAVVCLAAAVSAATTVLEIADDAGSVQIGAALDTALTRRNPGVLGATNLLVDNLLNVTGQATFGTTNAGPVLVKNNLNVQGSTALQGTTTVSGTTTLSGTTTVSGATTHSGTTTFNAQTTFNNNAPQVTTDLFVNGIIRHANAAYHRACWYGMTAKIYAGAPQYFKACGSPSAACSQGDMVVGFTNAGSPGGIGTYNDGWSFGGQSMWQGTDIGSPSSGFNVQNGFSVPTDPATGNPIVGFYRVSGSINLGGCTENANQGSSSAATTWRALYITEGYNSPTAPIYLRYFGGTSVREAYPKEVSLSVTDTILMQPGAWVWLSVTNNCVAPNTIATIQPLGPPSTLGGAATPMAGLYALFSITYVGE